MKDKLVNEMLDLKDSATKSQKKLIDFLIDTSAKDIIYMSITELSEMANVGEATILRFCRALGYRGYQDFKLALARGLNEQPKTEEDNYAYAIADSMIETLNYCKTKIDLKKVDEAVDVIIGSKIISLFGSGNSIVPAQEMHARLLKFGIVTNVEVSAHQQNIVASNLTENDCLIIFSVSGCSKDGIEVQELALARGAKVIVVTSYDKSPLAKKADIVLLSVKNESPADGGSLVTKIGQLYIVDVLCAGIMRKNGDAYRENVNRAAKAVVKKLI